MIYIGPEGQYPAYAGDIQLAAPEWKIGEPLPTGWSVVETIEIPELADDEKVIELAPQKVDGKYTQVFAIEKLTEEELEIKNAPKTARVKLEAMGLTIHEIRALEKQLVSLA